MNHPNIARIYETFEDERYYFIVMEYCEGGELLEYVSKKNHLDEKSTATVMKQAMYALSYLHNNNICHRDIKPENFLLASKNGLLEIKMIDFGLARKLKSKEDTMNAITGSPYYIAPEIFSENYTMKCDIWALGVLMYVLLCGRYPFNGRSNDDLFEAIRSGVLKMDQKIWSNYTEESKNFLKSLLKLNPNERPSAELASTDVWL